MRNDDARWRLVVERFAGACDFVYAVTTTGVFCRVGCGSRRPKREHVRFFANAGVARAAGYRACLRCAPEGAAAGVSLVSVVSVYLREHLDRVVGLAELGRVAGVSGGTVQRVFSRVVGMSPGAYTNALRAERFRAALEREASVTEAVYAAGFSGLSRAQEGAPVGMAPKTYKARGAGERIGYATEPSGHGGLGMVLVASTERGVCAVLLGSERKELVSQLMARFPAAELLEDARLASRVGEVLEMVKEPAGARELPLDLRGTAFQARVWAALRAIPRGETRTYAQVAISVGNPKAVRAVAQACAMNPVALVVPCHRVIGSDGRLTGYRWGVERKRLLLAWEQETPATASAGK